ncbi:hypothetical protein GUJ93_ZPchr0001g32688 [Zizania palustris]|uniref:Uncharacterized protein n=1 Tax=Zizania palustris TaxID=103762 RepID=A0A8J5SGQ5_ZIZPA|nr:hypothetical protein GUJ93_ZPchr0001g32688 [Zizania palustris]
MVQEIAMYGSGVAKEESSGNQGGSILGEMAGTSYISGSSIIGRWILVACAECAAAVIWVWLAQGKAALPWRDVGVDTIFVRIFRTHKKKEIRYSVNNHWKSSKSKISDLPRPQS